MPAYPLGSRPSRKYLSLRWMRTSLRWRCRVSTRGSSWPSTCGCSCASIRGGASGVGRVPEGVVRVGGLELMQCVEVLALVSSMFGDSLLRPGFGAGGGVVVGRVAYEVDGELAPDDQLVEVAVSRGAEGWVGFGCGFDCERDGERADVAEVKVGREAGGSVDLGVVAFVVVGGEQPWW